MHNLKRKIEALIFISETPITMKEIATFLTIKIDKCEPLINELIDEWEKMKLSIKIHKVSGGYQFRTEESYKDLLTQFHMNVAASIQAATEEIVLKLVTSIAKETGSKNRG